MLDGTMERRRIAQHSPAEFDALRQRLEKARDALRRDQQLLQCGARAYYLVYAVASFAAGRHGVKATHIRGGKHVTDQDFSHYEIADVVHALYTGGKRGNVTEPGSSPGIGSGNYTDHQAYRNVIALYQVRLEADYGPSSVPEPYPASQVDGWMTMANNLRQDLESLL
jgi:hypothetical protein